MYPQQGRLIGKTRWEIPWTAPDEDGWRRHRAVLEAHLPFRDFEFARSRQDGVMFYYSVSGEPMFDAAGLFTGYRGVGREIGDQKRAEQALRESSEKYEVLVSSIDGIVWEADPATFTFNFVSEQAERLLGYPSRQWLEPNFWRDHTHPEDVAWAGEYCARATAEKRNHEFEYRMIAADGRTVWLRDLVTVVVEDGVAVKLRGIMVDVTDRRRAELALRKSEERFRALTAMSSDFYWETDREHRFVMMEYGKSFRGPMPSNEFAGRIRWEIPSVAPNEEGWRAYRETVDAHRAVRGFGFARRVPGGEIRHYEIDGDPLFDPGGAFLGYRGVGRDVTERLRAERALRDSERRVRALLRRLTATQEAERRRIAADLHDFVGQNLTALGIGLERSAALRLRAGRAGTPRHSRSCAICSRTRWTPCGRRCPTCGRPSSMTTVCWPPSNRTAGNSPCERASRCRPGTAHRRAPCAERGAGALPHRAGGACQCRKARRSIARGGCPVLQRRLSAPVHRGRRQRIRAGIRRSRSAPGRLGAADDARASRGGRGNIAHRVPGQRYACGRRGAACRFESSWLTITRSSAKALRGCWRGNRTCAWSGPFGAGRDAIRYVESAEADVAVLDVAMPDLNGIEVARYLQDAAPATRIVMLSMHADVEYVHRALLAGAQGYVLKDSAGRVLIEAVRAVHGGRRYICEQIGAQALEQYFRERGISDPLARLSAREREVLQHTVEGKTIVETADRLQLSPKSVETYRSRLMSKLEIEDIPALVKFAIRYGITTVN